VSNRSYVRRRCRGDTEIVGMILLTAIVVVLMSVGGYYVLSNVGEDGAPNVEITGRATSDAVTLTHGGGASLDAASLDVVLRYGGSEQRYDFAADGTCGDEDGRFEPGERWTLDGSPPYDVGDTVELLLVDTDRDAVLFRSQQTATAPTATPTPAAPA
jgi:FlaG/FlaF family flagellin (archaellin)